METEDASARLHEQVAQLREQVAQLHEQVARQVEDLSTLEASHVGMSPFCFLLCWLFPLPVSKLVALLVELGEKVEVLEQDLEMTKATLGWRTEELAKSHEERRALEGNLDQIRNISQHVVSEIFRSAPSTSAPAVQLAEVLGEVWDLIRSGLFYGADGVSPPRSAPSTLHRTART